MNHGIRYISHKEMKKNIFLKRVFVFALFGILLTASGVLAETTDITHKVKEIVKDVVAGNGINETNIISIEQVDYENLPDAINVENIDTNNVAIYEVNVQEGKPFYVVTEIGRASCRERV